MQGECGRGRYAVAAMVLVATSAAAFGAVWDTARPQRPSFVRDVPDIEYEQRRAVHLATIDVDALARDTAPVEGLHIFKVEPDSQATRLDMRVDDYIVEVNDHPIAFAWQYASVKKKDGTGQVLLLQSRDGARREVAVKPGRIGIWWKSHWKPVLTYLRGRSRDPAWDDDVITGLTCFEENADLAGTALLRAIAAGYRPDATTDAVGAVVARKLGRHDDAVAFGRLALLADPSCLNAAYALGWSAQSSYRLRLARDVWRHYTTVSPDTAKLLDAVLADMPHALRDPIEAREMFGDRMTLKAPKPLLPSFEELNEYTGDMLKHALGGGMELSAPPEHCVPLAWGPHMTDCELALEFKFRKGKNQHNTPHFTCGFLLVDQEKYRHALVCSHAAHDGLLMNFHQDGKFSVLHANNGLCVYGEMQGVETDYKKRHRLRVVICGDMCAVDLDGVRVYFAPWLAKPSRVAAVIKVTGMKVHVRGLEYNALIDAPAGDDGHEVF